MPRTTALEALTACRRKNAWSDAVLKDLIARADLDARDAALCTTLCCGVLQNRALLDHYIDGLLTGRRKLNPVLRDILRLGAYQILFLDRVPDSAAVNEAVEQAKKQRSPQEAGLCNGLLRNLSRRKAELEMPKDYAVRYSHPAELVDLMKESVGKRLGKILEADNSQPETCAQWNPLRCGEEELLQAWQEESVTVSGHPWLEHCYLLRGTGSLERLPSFQRGMFQVQDAAARLSVLARGLQPGMKVLDLCAAPGGKSVAAAQIMGNRGQITACDVHAGKLPQIQAATRRLGAAIISEEENDASIFRPEWAGAFDAVIADVPCSGLGVIRKKPEIRYRDLRETEALPALQLRILEQAGAYVSPGGTLLYSTCTILRRENEAVVQDFLQTHRDFHRRTLVLPEPLKEQETGMLTLYQGIDDCDGFFLCRMEKQA